MASGVEGGERIGMAYVDLSANIQPMQAGLAAVTALLNGWVVKTQADMDTAMRNIWTIVDTNEQGLARYQQQIVSLARTVPQTQKQLAEGFYQLVSANIAAVDAMDLLEISAKAASAGLSTTYTAVDALTTVINAYGLSTDKAGIISDIMFKAVERGKITYEQLAGSMGQVISTAAAAGVSFEEIAAGFATMTRSGISADEASTALNQTMLSLISPSADAAKLANALGIEFNLQALQSKGLVGVLKDLDAATGGNVEMMNIFMPNVRALKGVLNLTRNEVGDFSEDLAIMENALGSTDAAFAKQADSVNNNFVMMKNAFSEWAIVMGEAVSPAVKGLTDGLGGLAKGFAALPAETQRVILVTTLAVTSFNVLQKAVGSVVALMSGPAGWIMLVGAAAAAIVTIVARQKDWNGELVKSGDALNNTIDQLIKSADKTGSAAVQLEKLITDYEKLTGKTKLNKEEQEKLNTVVAAIGSIAPGVVTAWDNMGQAIKINIDATKEQLKILFDTQQVYLTSALAANEKLAASMKKGITDADAELAKLAANYAKIQPLYDVNALISADKAGWNSRLSGLNTSMTLEQAIKHMAGGVKGFEDALRSAYKNMEATNLSFKNGSLYGNFSDLAYEANIAGRNGDYIIKDQADLLASKTVYDKLIADTAAMKIMIDGLNKTKTTLGGPATTGTGGKTGGTGTGTSAETAAALTDLDKLKAKIDIIFEPFTYQEKTLSGLLYAQKQLNALSTEYNKTHEERLATAQAFYKIEQDIATMQGKVLGELPEYGDNLMTKEQTDKFVAAVMEANRAVSAMGEIVSSGDLAADAANAKKATADIATAWDYWRKAMGDGLVPEYGDSLMTKADVDAFTENIREANRAVAAIAEVVSGEDLAQYAADAKAKKAEADAALDTWRTLMGGGLAPEYGDKLMTKAEAEAIVASIMQANRAASSMAEIVSADDIADDAANAKKALAEIAAAIGYWRETMGSNILPEYGDALMTKADVDAFMANLYEMNRAAAGMGEIVSSEDLAAGVANAKVALDEIAAAWAYWREAMGEGLLPEYGDKLMTKEEVDAYMEGIYAANRGASNLIPEYGDSLMTKEEADAFVAGLYEAARAAATMGEIVSSEDLAGDVASAKKATEDIAAAWTYWRETMGYNLLPEYGDKLMTKEEVDAFVLNIMEANRATAAMAEIVSGDDLAQYTADAKKAAADISAAWGYWRLTMGGNLLPEYGDALMTKEEVDAYLIKMMEVNRAAAGLSEIMSKEDFDFNAETAKKNADAVADAWSYWRSTMTDNLLPEYGDALLTKEQVDFFAENIRQANRAAAAMAEIVGAETFADNAAWEKEEADKVKAAQEAWVRQSGDLAPEYGDALLTKEQVDLFLSNMMQANRAISGMTEIISGDDLAQYASDAESAKKKIADTWALWRSTMGDNLVPESGDKLLTPEDVKIFTDKMMEANRAASTMGEIVSADDFVQYAEDAAVFAKQLKELAADTVGKFSDLVDGLTGIIGKALNGDYSSAGDAMDDAMGYFSAFAKSYWQGIGKMMDDPKMSFEGAIDAMNAEIGAKIQREGGKLADILQSIGTRLQEYDGTLLSNLGKGLSDFGSKLGSVLEQLGADAGLLGMSVTMFTIMFKGWAFAIDGIMKLFKWGPYAGNLSPDQQKFWQFFGYEGNEGDAPQRPAFQISDISGPMRDSIVTALDPLKVLYSYPTYKDEIVSAINSVRDALLGAGLGVDAARAGIAQTFNIGTINITAANGETFSEIMRDLDKKAQLGAASVGG